VIAHSAISFKAVDRSSK